MSGSPSGISPWAGLHVLADDDPRWSADPVALARAACEGGASVVQLRAKHATDAQVLAWGREIRQLTSAAGLRFVVNDRFDLALLCEADAVHLGQDDLPTRALPESARRRLAIGRSSHNLEQVRQLCHEAIAYLAFGPVFATTSKQSKDSACGLELLAAAAREATALPLVAIGGIDGERIAAVTKAGAAGAAVISAVAGTADPALATAQLVAELAGPSRAEGAPA